MRLDQRWICIRSPVTLYRVTVTLCGVTWGRRNGARRLWCRGAVARNRRSAARRILSPGSCSQLTGGSRAVMCTRCRGSKTLLRPAQGADDEHRQRHGNSPQRHPQAPSDSRCAATGGGGWVCGRDAGTPRPKRARSLRRGRLWPRRIARRGTAESRQRRR